MNENYSKITIHQFDLMKHALGLDHAKPKRGKCTVYRNYYCSYGKNGDWETLVECGVATYRVGNPELYPSSIFYHVSEDGLELMSNVLGFKIIGSE